MLDFMRVRLSFLILSNHGFLVMRILCSVFVNCSYFKTVLDASILLYLGMRELRVS